MKICYVANAIEFPYKGGPTSGGVTHVFEVACGYRKAGHEVSLLCRRMPGQDIDEVVDGIPVHRIFTCLSAEPGTDGVLRQALRAPAYFRKLAAESAELVRFLRRGRYDIVYERSSVSTRFRCLMYRALGVPFVLEVNDYADRLSLALARNVIVPNRSVLPQWVQSKTVELPWGANTDAFRPDIDGAEVRKRYGIDNGKRIVTIVCSGVPWHGLDQFIEAADMVTRKNPGTVFMVVGGGAHIADYMRKAGSLVTGSRCVFTGPISYPEIPKFVAAADITVAPYNSLLNRDSRTRALFASPLKVFEYMASGKPVIVSRIGNRNGVIDDMKTGIVVAEDSPDELAGAIMRLLDDAGLRKALGANARCVAEEKYSWQGHVARLVSVLSEK